MADHGPTRSGRPGRPAGRTRSARAGVAGAALGVLVAIAGIGALAACTPDVVPGSATMVSSPAVVDPLAMTPAPGSDPSASQGGAAPTDGATGDQGAVTGSTPAPGGSPSAASGAAPAGGGTSASGAKPTPAATFNDPLHPAPGQTRAAPTDASTVVSTRPPSGDAADESNGS